MSEYNQARVNSLVGRKRMAKINHAEALAEKKMPQPIDEKTPVSLKDQYHASKGNLGIINKALGGRFGPY